MIENPQNPLKTVISEFSRLYERERHYYAGLKLYQMVLEPTIKATEAQKAEARLKIEKTENAILKIYDEILAKRQELLGTILQQNPSLAPDELNQSLDVICDILQGHGTLFTAVLQALANKSSTHSAPPIINNNSNSVNCSGGHGSTPVATPAPAPDVSSAPTAPEASKGGGRVNIDLSDSKAIEQLIELIRMSLDDINGLTLRLTEMGVPNTHQIPILTAMAEKTARLRALVQS